MTENDGCQTRHGVEYPVDDCDTQTSLMNKVQIADTGDDERLVRTGRESLNDSSGEEVFIGDAGFTDSSSDDIKQSRREETWSFAIPTTQRTPDWTGRSGSEEIVPGHEDDLIQRVANIIGNDDIRRVQKGTICGCIEDCAKQKDADDIFLLDGRPIERIVRIFAGLRSKNNV